MSAHFFSLDGTSIVFSLQPLVREAGERDHVGPFVSRFPISACTPVDHDEVELRSSSTKDGTLCPVSGSSALDHHCWSMDEMVDHEEDRQDLVEECGWLVVEVHVDSVSM